MSTKRPVTKKTRSMKLTGSVYTDVTGLVRDTLDEGFADEFETYVADRRLVKSLTILRCLKEVSQADLAAKMGCGQPKLSKIENSADADLDFGDLVDYLKALDMAMQVTLTPLRTSRADRIRLLTAQLKRELDLERDDQTASGEVEALAIGTMQKMVELIETTIDRLPHDREATEPVTVVVQDERGEHLAPGEPKRFRKVANLETQG